MSRRISSRSNTSSSTTGKDQAAAGGSNSEGEAKPDDSLANAILLEDVMLIDKIDANLRLRSLDDPDILEFQVSLADCEDTGIPLITFTVYCTYSRMCDACRVEHLL